jgi:hypothetical protein
MTGEVDPPVAEAGTPDGLPAAVVSGLAYGLLFVLGVVLAVVSGFQHPWYVETKLLWLRFFPLAAVLWLPALFAVPYGMGRLMGRRLAALATAAGWGVAIGVLAGQRGEGDLVFAANSAGYIYLYGGTVVMVIAILLVPSTGNWLLGDPHPHPHAHAPGPPDAPR